MDESVDQTLYMLRHVVKGEEKLKYDLQSAPLEVVGTAAQVKTHSLSGPLCHDFLHFQLRDCFGLRTKTAQEILRSVTGAKFGAVILCP